MDTQNQPASKLPSIRTYAKDLESKRKEKGQALPAEPAVTVVETPAPKESFLKKKKPAVVAMPPIVVEEVPKPEKKPIPRPPIKKLDVGNLSAFNTKSTEFIVDNDDAAAATIITDTKRDRFKLFPAIVSSIKDWFENKKESYRQKKQPKYTVPETSRRKGVIQKATSLTGKLATSDFTSIHERIRHRQDEAEKETSHLSWSAKTEPGFLLLETSKKTAVENVQFINRKSYRTSPQEVIVQKTPVVVAKVEAVETVVVPEVIPVAVTVETLPSVKTVVETPVVAVLADETPAVETPVLAPEPVTETQPEVTTVKSSRLGEILSLNTNTLALGVSAVVLGILILITYIYISFSNQPQVTKLSTTEVSALIDSDLQEISLVSITQASAFAALVDIRSSLEKTTQVVFLATDNKPIPPYQLLPLLGFNLEQNFAKTLTQAFFGYTSDRQPFVLLEAADLLAAQGGLLVWEETMGTDFNNLFGITGLDLRTAFIDATLSGVDVRVLKTQSGTERLFYGVVDNMIIIATSSADFTELVNLRNR